MAAPVGNSNRATQYRLQWEIERVLRGESPEVAPDSVSESLVNLREMIVAQAEKAKGGDTQSFKELMDRWAGKPTQPMDVQADVNVKAYGWTK